MKKLLIIPLLILSFFAKAQVIPQWKALSGGLQVYYPGKSPSGYDNIMYDSFNTLKYWHALVPTAVKTSSYTLIPYDYVPTNTTSGAVALTLPTAPANGAIVGVKMVILGTGNNTTITAGGSDVFNKTGGGTSLTLFLLNQGVLLQYNSGIWYVLSDDLGLGQLDSRYVSIASPQLTLSSTNGYVWTAVGTSGFGSWQPLSGGTITNGANGLSASGANIVEGGSLTQNTNQANAGFYHRRDSTILGNHTVYTTPSGNVYVWGSSIAAGSTLGGGTSWPQTMATLLGLTLHNFAGSGNTVENRSPSNPAGGVSFLTQIGTIPTYSTLTGAVNIAIIEPGPNDWHSGYANYNTTNYSTDLTTWDNAFISAGWPLSQVYVLNNSYVNPSTYGVTGAGGLTITQSGYNAFKALSKSITASFGFHFIDVDAAFANGLNIGYLGIGDVLHPSQLGANFEGNFVASQINNGAVYAVQPGTIYGASQVGTFNGPVAASYLNLGTSIALSNAASNTLLGRNAQGDVASIQALPPGTISGATFIWNGKQKYLGIDTTNITLGPQDIVMPTGIKENYAYVPNNTYYGTLTKGTSIIGLDYTIHTYSNPTGSIFSLNSPSGTAFNVNQNGTASFLGAVTAPSFVSAFGGAGFTANTSGNSGGLHPFGTDLAGVGSNTLFIDYTGAGGIEMKTTSGVLGSFLERMKIDNVSGNVTIGVPSFNTGATTAANSGFNLEVSSTAKIDGNTYFGFVPPPTGTISATPSTTGGALPAGNKFYVLTTFDVNGKESNKSAEVSCTTTGTTGSVSVAFTGVSLGVSYRLYQSATSGTQAHYVTGTFTGTPIVDIGTYTAGSPPAIGANQTYVASISAQGNAALTTVITYNAPVAINATATATAAQIAGGYITSTSVAATTITLPTASLLATQLNARAGTVFPFWIDNTAGANNITVVLGTGMTGVNSPSLTVVTGTTGQAEYQASFSSPTACTIVRLQ